MSPIALQKSYPWTSSPLLINAPMATFISPALATEVTKAGGLAFLGAGYELQGAAQRLASTRELLKDVTSPAFPANDVLPVGIGVLCFAVSPADTVAMLTEHKPAAVWLFGAPQTADYAAWTSEIRAGCPWIKVWVQTNSVADAVTIARDAKPDVLVLQGSDAGGHGAAKGAGIISLFPEAADALGEAGFGSIPLVAAGGIADGRGVAAAIALGAAGVVLGTRFLSAAEAPQPHPAYRAALLAAKDGGQSTARSQVYDEVLFPKGNVWPASYDGRALRNLTVAEMEEGVALDEAKTRYAADKEFRTDMGASRAVLWAGASVGLVNRVQPAGEIVEEVRAGARRVLQGLGKL